MEIRRFKESDAKRVSRIITEQAMLVFSKYYTKELIDLYVRESRPEEILKSSKERDIFVAVDEGRIIGIGSLKGDTIPTISVDTTYQGKGVGKAIIGFLEEKVRQHGAKIAHVSPVAINAVGFYKKMGYHEIRSYLYRDIPNAKAFHMIKEL